MKPTYKQVTKTRYIEQIGQLAEEIFVQHYTKLTPKVARALAEKYQSDILTDDEIHSGTVNYFMIYLGSDPVGYFALDLTPTGAMCLSRLFLLEKARGQGIGRSIVAYAQKLAAKARPSPWKSCPALLSISPPGKSSGVDHPAFLKKGWAKTFHGPSIGREFILADVRQYRTIPA